MSIRNLGFLLSCARPLSAVEDTHSGRRAGPWCASLAVAGLVLALGLIHSSPGHSQQASKAGAAETIEFGANTSVGARDGLCADVRFENNPTSARPGMAQDLVTEDIFRDASDCYRAYVDNTVHLRENVDGIDFGTDQGSRDYTCQDSRFAPLRMSGERPAAAEPMSERTDASDCLLAYIAENVGLYDSTLHVVFGNDWGQWPNDEQCDDPRFRDAPGAGEPLMAEYTNTANVGRDASDCREAMHAGAIQLRPSGDKDQINFGDDTGRWAFDFECDDGRFEQVDPIPRDAVVTMSTTPSNRYVGRDATDCRDAYDQNSIVLTVLEDLDGISFGQDASDYSYDGLCDDPRFEDIPGNEPRMSSYLSDDDWGADATDCYRAYRDGHVRLAGSAAK